jgi:hypothetical protein
LSYSIAKREGDNVSRNIKREIFEFYESQKAAYREGEALLKRRTSKAGPRKRRTSRSKPQLNFEFTDVISLVEKKEIFRVILDLFEKIGEDHRDIVSWLMFVRFMAAQLLDKGQGGRPPKWQRPTKKILKRDFVACLRANPRLGREYIADEMVKKFPKKYGPITPSTLVRWIGTEIDVVEERHKVKAAAKAQKIRRN